MLIESNSDYIVSNISKEEWREYVMVDAQGNEVWVYHIDSPVTLIMRKGGSTHRVVDAAGITHCALSPANGSGVVIRWKSDPPVNF